MTVSRETLPSASSVDAQPLTPDERALLVTVEGMYRTGWDRMIRLLELAGAVPRYEATVQAQETEIARLRAALTAAQLPHDGECPTHWGSARRNCTCRIGAHNAAILAALADEARASVDLDYTDGRPQTQVGEPPPNA